MKTQNENQTMTKNAMRTFLTGSAIIFSVALYYCYNTEHFFALKLLAGAVIGLATLITVIYKSK